MDVKHQLFENENILLTCISSYQKKITFNCYNSVLANFKHNDKFILSFMLVLRFFVALLGKACKKLNAGTIKTKSINLIELQKIKLIR